MTTKLMFKKMLKAFCVICLVLLGERHTDKKMKHGRL